MHKEGSDAPASALKKVWQGDDEKNFINFSEKTNFFLYIFFYFGKIDYVALDSPSFGDIRRQNDFFASKPLGGVRWIFYGTSLIN